MVDRGLSFLLGIEEVAAERLGRLGGSAVRLILVANGTLFAVGVRYGFRLAGALR